MQEVGKQHSHIYKKKNLNFSLSFNVLVLAPSSPKVECLPIPTSLFACLYVRDGNRIYIAYGCFVKRGVLIKTLSTAHAHSHHMSNVSTETPGDTMIGLRTT